MSFMIKTPDGKFLGATTIGGQLKPQPRAFGYVYDTREDAEADAANFPGCIVVEL